MNPVEKPAEEQSAEDEAEYRGESKIERHKFLAACISDFIEKNEAKNIQTTQETIVSHLFEMLKLDWDLLTLLL